MNKAFVVIAGGLAALLLIVMFFDKWGLPSELSKQAIPVESSSISLRFGHNTPENSALHQASLLFSEKVREKTAGKVVIEVFPAQQLGNDHQMVEMARNGDLDILLTPTAKMSVPVPSMQYADLPFFFPSREDVYEMLDGEPGQMLFKDLKKIGLYGLAFWENGFKHFTGNTPFLMPEDFTNKKIRVMKSRIIMEQFHSFDAEAVAIDFHATRQALADGVVDGQENPLIAIYSMGFHEVQSDLVLSEHAYLGYVLSVSEKTMSRLSFQVKRALFEAAHEVTPWERQETQKREQQLLEKIRASGINVHRLNAEQRKAFSRRTAHIVSQFEDVIGTALISKTEELLERKYGSGEDVAGPLIIGVNADLTNSPSAGLAIKRGVQLALDDINARGGVQGRKLHLVVRDHQMVASRGLENMKSFIRQPQVIAVVGGKHSAIIAEELELVNEARMPYLIPWAAAEKITESGLENNAIFRISANDRMASEFIADYTLQHHQSPAIIVENTIWGRGNLEKMKLYMSQKGVVPAVELIFNRGQDSYLKQLSAAIKSGADSVILVANAKEGSIIVSELAQLTSSVSIVSHWGILGGDFFQQNQQVLPGLDLKFFQTFLFSQADSPKADELLQKYGDKYALASGQGVEAQHAVAQAYDLVQVLALAIEKAGSVDRSEIVKAMAQPINYNGVIKRYAPVFSTDNHDGLNTADFFMAHFNEHGQIVRAK